MTHKLNALGKRCDMKMTANGRVACIAPGCRRKATVCAKGVDQFHAAFHCDNPAHHGGVREIIGHNEQGYVADTSNVGGWGLVDWVAKWQDRHNSSAYLIR